MPIFDGRYQPHLQAHSYLYSQLKSKKDSQSQFQSQSQARSQMHSRLKFMRPALLRTSPAWLTRSSQVFREWGWLSLVASLLVLSACQSPKTESKESTQSNAPQSIETSFELTRENLKALEVKVTRAVELNEDHSNLDSYQASLNHFQVKVLLPLSSRQSRLYLLAAAPHPEPIEMQKQETPQGWLWTGDLSIPAQHRNRAYTVRVFLEQAHQRFEAAPLQLYRDIVIMGESRLEQSGLTPGENRVGRIFLGPDAKLITGSSSIRIFAQEMISAGAEWMSFSEEEAATPLEGQPGKHGGQISLQTHYFSGLLRAQMRGTRGAPGAPGKSYSDAETPPPALAGQNGLIVCRSHEIHFTQTINEILERYSPNSIVCSIERAPQNGKNATPGKPGGKGFQGLAGGDSGSFYFSSKESAANSQVQIQIKPGLGGASGAGGSGQKAGAAGAAGLFDVVFESSERRIGSLSSVNIFSHLGLQNLKIDSGKTTIVKHDFGSIAPPSTPVEVPIQRKLSIQDLAPQAQSGYPALDGESGPPGEIGRPGLSQTSCFSLHSSQTPVCQNH